MNDTTKAAVKTLKEAMVLCERYRRENNELLGMVQDLIDNIEKFKRLERQLILTPNMN